MVAHEQVCGQLRFLSAATLLVAGINWDATTLA